jgi:hypothetical protein
MKFHYAHLPTKRPVYSLSGAQFRDRPIIPVELKGPRGTRHIDCSVDPGSDDTLFPAALARVLGIPLTQPPDHGEAMAIGGASLTYAYGHARLRISDGFEACEWAPSLASLTCRSSGRSWGWRVCFSSLISPF